MNYPFKNNQNGLSLIEIIISIVGISIITVAIITINMTSVKLTNYNMKNDQAFQIARSVMEEVKTKLLFYSGENQILIGFNQTNQAHQSSICKGNSEYYCDATNQDINLVELAKIMKASDSQCTANVNPNPITSTDAKTVLISMKNQQNEYYSVKIEASIPPKESKLTYNTNSDLYLCKYIRKFKVTVTPPGSFGNKPVFIEAFYPIPS